MVGNGNRFRWGTVFKKEEWACGDRVHVRDEQAGWMSCDPKKKKKKKWQLYSSTFTSGGGPVFSHLSSSFQILPSLWLLDRKGTGFIWITECWDLFTRRNVMKWNTDCLWREVVCGSRADTWCDMIFKNKNKNYWLEYSRIIVCTIHIIQ